MLYFHMLGYREKHHKESSTQILSNVN